MCGTGDGDWQSLQAVVVPLDRKDSQVRVGIGPHGFSLEPSAVCQDDVDAAGPFHVVEAGDDVALVIESETGTAALEVRLQDSGPEGLCIQVVGEEAFSRFGPLHFDAHHAFGQRLVQASAGLGLGRDPQHRIVRLGNVCEAGSCEPAQGNVALDTTMESYGVRFCGSVNNFPKRINFV